MKKGGVGFVYDCLMELHAPRETDDPDHPECPARHAVIVDAMKKRGMTSRCVNIKSRNATSEEMMCVHSSRYIDSMKMTAGGSDKLCHKREIEFEYDVYVNPSSWDSAVLSLGCSLKAMEAVVKGRVRHALACVRPPGHHACQHKAMGFCFLNNAACCAKLAIERHGLKRILICDFDVHHGNGTQDMCYDDPRICYFSVHRGFELKEAGFPFYPGTGAPTEVGSKEGVGFNVNVRWSRKGMGDPEYAECWRQVFMPIATEFEPQLVIVSAGFDAARGDPLGQCQLSPRGYFDMIAPIGNQFPTLVVLEGGYNLDIIGECFAACSAALLGDKNLYKCLPEEYWEADDGPCDEDALKDIKETRNVHKAYWKSLEYSVDGLVDEMTGISIEATK